MEPVNNKGIHDSFRKEEEKRTYIYISLLTLCYLIWLVISFKKFTSVKQACKLERQWLLLKSHSNSRAIYWTLSWTKGMRLSRWWKRISPLSKAHIKERGLQMEPLLKVRPESRKTEWGPVKVLTEMRIFF